MRGVHQVQVKQDGIACKATHHFADCTRLKAFLPTVATMLYDNTFGPEQQNAEPHAADTAT